MVFFSKKPENGFEPEPAREPTPKSASKHFHAWLDAVNGGNMMQVGRFLQENGPKLENTFLLMSEMSYPRGGGFDLRRTEAEEETRFVAILHDRGRGLWTRVILESEPTTPWSITRLDYEPTSPLVEFEVRRTTEAEAFAALTRQLDEATAAETFSGAVTVAKDGETVFSAARGLANRETAAPNEVGSRFKIASMTKIFTAVGTIQLVQQGLLDLKEPIGTYISDYPNQDAASRVTAHQLLTHTSGLTSATTRFAVDPRELVTLADWVRAYGPIDLEHEPGTIWQYSNYGYNLLGYLIERISGHDFYDYIDDNVFRTAGMEGSKFTATGREAIGYQRNFQSGEWEVGMTASTPPIPAGQSYSTVEDLQRFIDALLGHRLLDQHHTQLLLEPKVDARWGGKESYGCEAFEYFGIPWLARTGTTMSENAEFRIYPDSGYRIAVLTNMGAPAAFRIARFIGDRLPAK